MTTNHEERNRELTRRFYAAAAKADMATMTETLSDKLVIVEGDSLPFAGSYRGKDALMKLANIVHAHFGGMSLQLHEVGASGDWTFALLDICPSGRAERVSLVETARYDADGKMVEIRPFYFDHDQVRRFGVG